MQCANAMHGPQGSQAHAGLSSRLECALVGVQPSRKGVAHFPHAANASIVGGLYDALDVGERARVAAAHEAT